MSLVVTLLIAVNGIEAVPIPWIKGICTAANYESATTSQGFEDGPWKGPGPPLLVAADFISIHKPPASIGFAPIKHALAVTVEPFRFSSRPGRVTYELS